MGSGFAGGNLGTSLGLGALTSGRGGGACGTATRDGTSSTQAKLHVAADLVFLGLVSRVNWVTLVNLCVKGARRHEATFACYPRQISPHPSRAWASVLAFFPAAPWTLEASLSALVELVRSEELVEACLRHAAVESPSSLSVHESMISSNYIPDDTRCHCNERTSN